MQTSNEFSEYMTALSEDKAHLIETQKIYSLTPMEAKVSACYLNGQCYDGVGVQKELSLTYTSVEKYSRKIRDKTNTKSLGQALVKIDRAIVYHLLSQEI